MTTITALPPAPSRANPAAFADLADAFVAALPAFGTEANAVAGEVNTNASTATTKAAEALASANNAAASESAADAAATTATTKAGEALTSANNAAASYDAFDDRYLGSKSSDPALDNDSNALLTGALYWNSVDSKMKVYNGSAWEYTYLPASSYVNITDIGVTVQPYMVAGMDYITPTGTESMSNKTITAVAMVETKVAMPANAVDLATGNFFTKTFSAGAVSLTVSNVPSSGKTGTFILETTNAGLATITWPTGTKWQAGAAPTLTSSGVDILGFYTHDAGTTWRGLVLAKDSK